MADDASSQPKNKIIKHTGIAVCYTHPLQLIILQGGVNKRHRSGILLLIAALRAALTFFGRRPGTLLGLLAITHKSGSKATKLLILPLRHASRWHEAGRTQA